VINTTHDLESHPLDSIGFKEGHGGSSSKYQGWTLDVESVPINQFAIDPSSDIGGYRLKWVETEVPRVCCWCRCGTKMERVQVMSTEVQPNPAVVERRREMARRAAQRSLQGSPQQGASSPKLGGHASERMASPGGDLDSSTSAEPASFLLGARPMSPKGPMGGTFSAGFRAQELTAKPLGANPEGASAMAGFRPGQRPGTAMGLASLQPGTGVAAFGPQAGADEQAGSNVQFSSKGAPMAERLRPVSRAPKPELKRLAGPRKNLKIQIGA